MPDRLVLCGGARRTAADTTLKLALSGARQNIKLKLEDVGRKLIKKVPDLLADLVEIATYVYCADQATSRGGAAQRGMGRDLHHDFRFVIPVRNPDHWSQGSGFDQLSETLWFLSEQRSKF